MRFQLPKQHPLKVIGGTAYLAAQIPKPLYEQGVKPDLLARLRYLAWSLGAQDQEGLRVLRCGDLRLTTSMGKDSCFLVVEKEGHRETPLTIPVQVTPGGIVTETVMWRFPLADMDGLKRLLEDVVRQLQQSFLIHPTSGEIFSCQGQPIQDVQVDPDWYFSDEGAYVLPGAYGHSECYRFHFARADEELGVFKIGDIFAICRLLDRELAELRAKCFYDACNELLLQRGRISLSLEAEEETTLRELAWSADKRFERLKKEQHPQRTH